MTHNVPTPPPERSPTTNPPAQPHPKPQSRAKPQPPAVRPPASPQPPANQPPASPQPPAQQAPAEPQDSTDWPPLAKSPAPATPPWWRRLARVQDLRLLPAALLVWLATLLGVQLGWLATVLTGGIAALLGVLVFARAPKPRRTMMLGPGRTRKHSAIRAAAGAVVLCGLVTAVLTGGRLHDQQVGNPLAALANQGATVDLAVVLTDQPKPVASVGFAGRPGGVRTVTIQAEAESVGATAATGPVLLLAPAKGWSALLVGQHVHALGALEVPIGQQDLVAVLRVRGGPQQVSQRTWPQRTAATLRTDLRTAAAGLPGDAAGLLPALVIGDQRAVPPSVLEDFQHAGMAYLMAVGGFHLMVACGGLLWLLRRIGVDPRLGAALAAVVLLGFVEIAGPRPNVLRAAVMVGLGLVALAIGRVRSTCAALSGSVIALTWWRPEFGADLGFGLSVLATGAMVLLARPVARALVRRRFPPGVAHLLAVALVAQLATAPLIAAAYGQLSFSALLANALAEPAFVPVMLLGTLAMACAPWWPWLAGVCAHLTVPAIGWLTTVAHQSASLPAAAISWPTGWLGGLALAALLIAVVVAVRFRRLRALLAAALVGVVVVLVPIQVINPGWPPPGWAMVDCDVGQGDGEVLATGEPGRAVIVDTGPDEIAMDECLHRLDIDRVPLLILSHLHADHVGGLAAVLRGRSVGAIAVGPTRVPAWAWTQVQRQAHAAGVPVVALTVGEQLRWPTLTVDVLGPPAAEAWPTGDDPSGTVVNNSSLVLRANTTLGRVLLTGDVELAAQADLLQSGVDLTAAVLKVPHHGSRYSAPTFLDAVHARIAVASVGLGNPYGHPSPLTLDRLRHDGALVLRTDQDGDVALLPSPHGPVAIHRGSPRPAPHTRR